MYGALMTQAEAADRLRVSRRTIRRYAQNGELPPPIRIGRNAYYSSDTVRDFIDNKINLETREQIEQKNSQQSRVPTEAGHVANRPVPSQDRH